MLNMMAVHFINITQKYPQAIIKSKRSNFEKECIFHGYYRALLKEEQLYVQIKKKSNIIAVHFMALKEEPPISSSFKKDCTFHGH